VNLAEILSEKTDRERERQTDRERDTEGDREREIMRVNDLSQ